MGYRSTLEGSTETVQEVTLAASRRLDEAQKLFVQTRYHTAIYLGGLSAEMFLKTACFAVDGAGLADPISAHLQPIKSKQYKPPFKADFESGHGLWFWSQELISRRTATKKRLPNRFLQVSAVLYNDWFVGMRYRSGAATMEEAAVFLQAVEWIADNYTTLRS